MRVRVGIRVRVTVTVDAGWYCKSVRGGHRVGRKSNSSILLDVNVSICLRPALSRQTEGAPYCLSIHITHSLHSSGGHGGGVTSIYYGDIVGLPKKHKEYQVNQHVLYMQCVTALIAMHQDEMQARHQQLYLSNGAQMNFEPKAALAGSC